MWGDLISGTVPMDAGFRFSGGWGVVGRWEIGGGGVARRPPGGQARGGRGVLLEAGIQQVCFTTE